MTTNLHTNSNILQLAHQDLGRAISQMKSTCEQIQQSLGAVGSLPGHSPSLQRQSMSVRPIHLGTVLYPTDFEYILNLASDILKEKGKSFALPSRASDCAVTKYPSRPINILIAMLQAARPLLELGHDKVTRLLSTFLSEVYPLYPCINMQLAQTKVDALFELITPISTDTASQIEGIDIEIMKAVIAVVMLVRGETESPLPSDLESHIVWNVNSILDQEQPQIEDIIMATLLVRFLIYAVPKSSLTARELDSQSITISKIDQSRHGDCQASLSNCASN